MASNNLPDDRPLALIALGSNLGDSTQIIQQAMDRLEALSAEPIRRSRLYRSTPVDCPPGSPDFVNAAVALSPQAGETPPSLLKKLQDLEKGFGRKTKVVHNEPRPLDLDLIAYGSTVMTTPELSLPHPCAHQRAFVLKPLHDIAPDFVLNGKTVSQLLARCPDESCEVIP